MSSNSIKPAALKKDLPTHTMPASKRLDSNAKHGASMNDYANHIETYSVNNDVKISDRALADQEGPINAPVSGTPYITSEQYDNFMSLFLTKVEEGAKVGDPELMPYYRELVLGYDMGLSSEVEKLAYYYYYVQNNIDNSSSFNDMVLHARRLMELDAEDNFRLLHSTPILRHDDNKTFSLWSNYEYYDLPCGNYLQFYNENRIEVVVPLYHVDIDGKGGISTREMNEYYTERYCKIVSDYYAKIMNKSLDYSDKFRDICFSNLDSIYFPDFQGNVNHIDYAAYVSPVGSERSSMVINGFELKIESDNSYMISAFTHELGHVFANASSSENGFLDVDVSSGWRAMWERAKRVDGELTFVNNDSFGGHYVKNENPYRFLRKYAFESPVEGFAECVAEYFATDVDDPLYNPNDLKAIEINYQGYETLYDYMDYILN